MANGFAGFQTQLSETFNKQAQKDDPLLEAFLDANGRLAFRFIDSSGNIVPQPRVTTPGFIPPSLGISPVSPTTPSTSPSPTASGGLVGRPLIGSDEGRGAPDAPSGVPQAVNVTAPSTELDVLSGALGFAGPVGGLMSAVRRGIFGQFGVVGGSLTPQVGTELFSKTVAAGREASRLSKGPGPLGPLSGLDRAVTSNPRSTSELDNTNSLGGALGGLPDPEGFAESFGGAEGDTGGGGTSDGGGRAGSAGTSERGGIGGF